MEKNGVHVAFELLLKELESVADTLHDQGAEAFRRGDLERVKQASTEAEQLAQFREKVKALQNEWATLRAQPLRPRRSKALQRTQGKLPPGLCTPENAFRKPILEALVELGGSAPLEDVLDLVERKMKNVLNAYDKEPLPSNPRQIRWRNAAQWCRAKLVREGLIESGSPRGTWEITEAGRRWLLDEQSAE
jgi:hypothetical protein